MRSQATKISTLPMFIVRGELRHADSPVAPRLLSVSRRDLVDEGVDDSLAETEAGERGQGADREVANDDHEFLVAEDPLGSTCFIGPDCLVEQGKALQATNVGIVTVAAAPGRRPSAVGPPSRQDGTPEDTSREARHGDACVGVMGRSETRRGRRRETPTMGKLTAILPDRLHHGYGWGTSRWFGRHGVVGRVRAWLITCLMWGSWFGSSVPARRFGCWMWPAAS
jgi:hypothetical protein